MSHRGAHHLSLQVHNVVTTHVHYQSTHFQRPMIPCPIPIDTHKILMDGAILIQYSWTEQRLNALHCPQRRTPIRAASCRRVRFVKKSARARSTSSKPLDDCRCARARSLVAPCARYFKASCFCFSGWAAKQKQVSQCRRYGVA